MYFDLSLFSDSLFMFSHSIILESASLIKVCVSTLFSLLLNVLMVLDKVVSLAYIIKSNFFVDSGKSFIYMINNNGPRIDPCGTPIVKGKISDLLSSISVYCFLFLRMLRWTRKDHVRNQIIQDDAKMCQMPTFLRQKRLHWYGHVKRRR